MSRDASISLDFADGTHKFRLAWGQLAELQESCDAGPYIIYERLNNRTWRLNDIRETIRIGLIGGGMTPPAALTLVRRYVEERPPLETLPYAKAILSVALIGAPEENVGEPKAASRKKPRKSTTSRTGKFDLPQSTETGQ
ncbi:gene transfer agent family protein [Ochrobactrum quorumnocens]|uniref:Gene transfer agent family protein n=1 Tax=Ochrobactrum quorumnocens TaxID=271865 RepID=A0A5N1K0E9_9HYPH|nr:gene transfer agent family protein [[Ochrobactrum] quorumnocens]KAA9369563.1 gene transfer agent family protein [[Ochrobactrum] quorumnocens]